MPTPITFPTPADRFRFQVMASVAQTKSFESTWPQFRSAIEGKLGSSPTGEDIFALGDHLRPIFRAAAGPGRSQSEVSAAGTVWECLVVYYLNLVLYGSDVVATRFRVAFVPKPLRDTLSVMIQNKRTNSESDVLCYSIPNASGLPAKPRLKDIEAQIKAAPRSCDLAVVQCKTNWNDNAQIPMLWDLVYRGNFQGGRIGQAVVGAAGYNPSKLGNFSYAFMTAPTTKPEELRTTSTAVLRVSNMSGGNFWGLPAKEGVARGISEFVPRNFVDHLQGSSESHINRHLLSNPAVLRRFLDLDFAV